MAAVSMYKFFCEQSDTLLCFWGLSSQDNGGLSDTTTVLIEVTDFDNMNPYFDHALYKAFIQEEQVSYIFIHCFFP